MTDIMDELQSIKAEFENIKKDRDAFKRDFILVLTEQLKPLVQENERLKKEVAKLQEKQTPKKPLEFQYVDKFSYFYICPECKTAYLDNHLHDYCGDCGQRFLWIFPTTSAKEILKNGD